jgi:hypothetical protein
MCKSTGNGIVKEANGNVMREVFERHKEDTYLTSMAALSGPAARIGSFAAVPALPLTSTCMSPLPLATKSSAEAARAPIRGSTLSMSTSSLSSNLL